MRLFKKRKKLPDAANYAAGIDEKGRAGMTEGSKEERGTMGYL